MAGTAEDWQVQLVRDELVRAGDIGEQRSRADLQAAVGIGGGDLEAALDALRSEGAITEEAPDRWASVPAGVREARAAAVAADEEPEAEPAPAAGHVRVMGDAGGLEELSLAEAERRAGRGAPSAGGRVPVESKRIELPFGVADALDEAALGKIVKAGLAEAQAVGASLVIVVTT